jgi:molybdate transport system regulatory protein
MPKIRITPQPTLRLQIKHGIAIGPGKAALLEAIAATGSIAEACKLLKMSYRGGWELVNSMNEHFVGPLVDKTKGGSTRGGAALTPLGVDVLELYRQMEQRAVDAIRDDVARLEALLTAAETPSAVRAVLPHQAASATSRRRATRRA